MTKKINFSDIKTVADLRTRINDDGLLSVGNKKRRIEKFLLNETAYAEQLRALGHRESEIQQRLRDDSVVVEYSRLKCGVTRISAYLAAEA